MIELVNVSKYYHTKTSVALGLRKINLHFGKCGFVVITGESGSGKSTLLNVISGSDVYEEGEIYFKGVKTSHYTEEELEDYRRNNIAFIYQSYNLIDSYTAVENVKVSLLIREDISDLEDRALDCLERVGLSSRAENRAAQLSSGQKQRLAIARALAKDTDIIVADEPTGNLDAENGLQIMKILHELSKEKLVIVVTHNYEQTINFATRKIRMFNGEVAEDIDMTAGADIAQTKNGIGCEESHGNGEEKDDTDSSKIGILGEYIGYSKWDFKKQKLGIAWNFVKTNRKNQPKRNMLLFMLFLFISFSALIFLGGIISNLDDAMSGYYSDKAFRNGEKTRIIVRKPDGSEIRFDDVAKVRQITHVREVDTYDSVNDINYFMDLGKDYKMEYRKPEIKGGMMSSAYVKLLKFDRFMRSADCLDRGMLSEGALPEKRGDIVLYSKDPRILGQKITIYLCNTKMWTDTQYVKIQCTVAGILKNPTEQVYFSNELCRTISVDKNSSNANLIVKYTETGRGLDSKNQGVTKKNYRDCVLFKNPIFIPIEGFDDKSIKMSSVFYDEASKANPKSNLLQRHKVGQEALIAMGNIVTLKDANIPAEDLYEYKIMGGETGSSHSVVEIGYGLFNKLYPALNSRQMSVYIDNYAYMDEALKSINDEGYETISVYRTGITSYDYDKSMSMIKAMLISAASLIFVFFIGLFIIYMLLKTKKGDFIIFKSIGMKQSQVKSVNYLDLFSGFLYSSVISVFTAVILSWLEVGYITNIMAYYKLRHYIIYFSIIACLAWLTGKFYGKYLRRHDGIINLKTDN